MAEINLSELHPKTRHGLQAIFESLDRQDLIDRMWLGLDQAGEVFFLLRALEDKPEWFPTGKWATLQRLETLCERAAQACIEDYQSGGRDA